MEEEEGGRAGEWEGEMDGGREAEREECMHMTEKMWKLTVYQANPRLSVWECTSVLPARGE